MWRQFQQRFGSSKLLLESCNSLSPYSYIYRGVKETLIASTSKRVFWNLIKSPMIFCLIWLLSYEGSISNSFQVWRNTGADIVVILVLLQRQNRASGDRGCTIRTIILFQLSWTNEFPMTSNLLELAVASSFYSSAMIWRD